MMLPEENWESLQQQLFICEMRLRSSHEEMQRWPYHVLKRKMKFLDEYDEAYNKEMDRMKSENESKLKSSQSKSSRAPTGAKFKK